MLQVLVFVSKTVPTSTVRKIALVIEEKLLKFEAEG